MREKRRINKKLGWVEKKLKAKLKAYFHPWFNAVFCFCFEIALLLNYAFRLANYFYQAFLKHNMPVVRKSITLCSCEIALTVSLNKNLCISS